MRFGGKRVVVTGAAGVYGRELAAAFAAEGARLLLADRDVAGLLDGLPGEGHAALAGDLTQDAAIDALATAGTDADVLVNNAGVYPFIALMQVTPADWDRILGVNLRAPFRLMQAIGGAMARRGGGAIVNTSSAAAEVVRGNGVPYGTSKCALEFLTRAFALELGEHQVRVNAVRPGFAEGSAHVSFPPGYAEVIKTRLPLGRNIAPGEFAKAMLFLASDDASYVTGTVLHADGGSSFNRRDGAAARAGAPQEGKP